MHGVILLSNRKSYVSFIRELTAFLVKYFTEHLKIPGLIFKNIFDHRPYTRSVVWGNAYRILVNYMKKNESESGVRQMESLPIQKSAKSRTSSSTKGRRPNSEQHQLLLLKIESGQLGLTTRLSGLSGDISIRINVNLK
jgi:hypothetical protein